MSKRVRNSLRRSQELDTHGKESTSRFSHATLFRHKRSKSRESGLIEVPKDISEVHDVVDNIKKHNKRYKKELDALEEAYSEKCQENFFLKQQLQIYMDRFGCLEEIEDMVVALTENSDNSEEDIKVEYIEEFNGNEAADIFSSDDFIQETTPEDSPEPSTKKSRPLAKTSQITRSSVNWIPPHLRQETPNSETYQSSPDLQISTPEAPVTSITRDFAYLPVETLTKSQLKRHSLMVAQQNQLPHEWNTIKKKSAGFRRSTKLVTVHNRTKADIYISVYDKRRVGVGKHVRISAVYCVSADDKLSFEKPYSRSSRTRWLLFCRNSVHFDESTLTMNPSVFRNIPSYSIDFNDEVYIYESEEGALKATSKLQWKTRKQKQNILRKSGSIKISRKNNHNHKTKQRGSSDLKNETQLAIVRKEVSLAPEESQFLIERDKITKNALCKFLDVELEGKYVPRIAFCGSGGGCRAMVSTMGSMVACELAGLLDCFTYIAGVSGSTWTIGLLESLALTPSLLRENIISKFEANLISRPSKKGTSELLKTLRTNWGTKQKNLISLIDIYGAQLSTGLLNDTVPKSSHFKLSHQIPRVMHGAYPLPIYTAVQKGVKGANNWFEFTPFEVGCTDFEAFVPSWGFGRSYNVNGESTDFTPDPPLGTLLATFGSAFCAPLSRMAEEFFDKLEREVNTSDDDSGSPVTSPTLSRRESPARKESSNFKSTILEHRNQWNNLMHRMSLNNSKIAAPAKFHNFAYDPRKEASKQRKPILELVDAGIDGNLPFPPLLRPERGIDIIIACNASKSPNIDRSRSLRAAEKWAKDRGVKVPPIDFEHSFDSHCSVYRDEDDPNCPIIIYLPLKTNPGFSEFDPQENQRQGGYCSTFNFSMTRDQVEELSGLTQYNMKQSLDIIKQAIMDVIESRSPPGSEEEPEDASTDEVLLDIDDTCI